MMDLIACIAMLCIVAGFVVGIIRKDYPYLGEVRLPEPEDTTGRELDS